MKKEIRTAVYEDALQIEAYYFEGMVHPFPIHFHEQYVIGLIEQGERYFSCKNQTYSIKTGNMLLLHPRENHACLPKGEESLCYRGLHIPEETMLELTTEIVGTPILPSFSQTVVYLPEVTYSFRKLHDRILSGDTSFGKEETLFFVLSTLLQQYGQPLTQSIPPCRQEIEKACLFMKEHTAERISLTQLCHITNLSKSTLLRAFTKTKGITPYRYFENIRINAAKQLLTQGVSPLEAAIQTGFSDQSHFTNYFSSFIGVTPSVYRELFFDKEKEGD